MVWCIVCGESQGSEASYVEVDKGPICDALCFDAYVAEICGHCGEEWDDHKKDCPTLEGPDDD